MKSISVTCAIIIHQGKILAARRSQTMDLSGKWEFPGGKMEEDEEAEDCLIREILEELGITIISLKALTPVNYSYPTKTIRLIPFLCSWESGEISLLEHEQVCWLEKKDLFSLDWAEADLPIVHELQENWVKLVGQTERN
ncbi:8-oxo-dGTP diphosphatase [Algoriphagus boseongensis]|uniref:8-oxo-dGTP diphosphatase n=1 Tax=Algoriphagus boseongensis TaxID=1442587 RepID=A0A4V3D1Z4_9BACT|nr:(deoxy)nucleoside triphosphate pyrophosphohydrolase [Algoriphagus boseongensis]TDQ15219.1 8-oxo-dGTP diphosphatase [Algoriphagus boseongensis]